MVRIDQDICIGCGTCIRDCFNRALVLEDGRAKVTKPCIECGHCVALCPVRAVSIPEYDMEDIEEYDAETFSVNPENMLHAVKFRRSIRNYRPYQIEREKAEHILDAGRYSATAKNLQGCTFIFVQENLEEFKRLVWGEMPEILKMLEKTATAYARVFGGFYEKWKEDPKADNLFFNAPSFLMVASDNPLDGGLAAANIENVAVAEGLGALYSGYLMRIISARPALREWLGMGEKAATCCMLLGYPAVTYLRTAPRKKGDIIWK